MADTPFRSSGRVTGEGFFGRSETIRTVLRNLRNMNNVAIVGPSRMGKSSLLTLIFRNYKRADKEALTWFTDMRELDTLDDLVEEFYIAMGSMSKNHSLNALAKTLREFQKRVVIFIDSAERFAEPPFNVEALFAVLSMHLASQNISLCLATSLPPETILRNAVGFPLHKLFIRCDLPPFSPDECEELIEKKLQWTGIHFNKDDVSGLIEQSKGHPGELQRLAAELFREKTAAETERQRKR